MSGPLSGIRVVELGGIGPGPFAAMSLADMGAEVVRIDRPGGAGELFPGRAELDFLNRGKRSAIIDLKQAVGVDVVLSMVAVADVLIEGYRPGVAERLGLGPQDCWERNPALVYGRMTGWGQTGPLARTAGHDLTYLAVTGGLHAIGQADGPPQVPLNLVGDFGGGGAYLVIGVLAALLESKVSGRGQVVDAGIVDGASHLLAGTHSLLATGTWRDERGVNLLDGGAPFYAVYQTGDGEFVAVAALENRFYRELVGILGLDLDPARQHDRETWPHQRALLSEVFATKSRAAWDDAFRGTDACVAPVMSLREAARHPHVAARGSVVERHGAVQPGTAPRFSRTGSEVGSTPPRAGENTAEVLRDWGIANAQQLISNGVAAQE